MANCNSALKRCADLKKCLLLSFVIHCKNTLNLKKMNKLMTNRNLTIINFVIVTYFGLIYLLNFYTIDFVLIGVFREMLTIPFLLAQIVFLVLGIIHLIKHKTHFLTIISIIGLAISAIYTIGWFF